MIMLRGVLNRSALSAVGCAAAGIAIALGGCMTDQQQVGGTPKVAGHVPGEPAPMIPREVLFGNPDRSALRISPDGKRIAYLAPVNGVMNVWVAPVEDVNAARAVTSDTGRGIRIYQWAYTGEHIAYIQDVGGDENWKVFVADVATGEARDLTPIEEIPGPDGKPIMLPSGKKMRPAARIMGMSDKHPDVVLVGLNDRNPVYHDVYRINIRTGERTLVLKNDGFAAFETDSDLAVRLAVKPTEDGGQEVMKITAQPGADGTGATFERLFVISSEDLMTSNLVGFDREGKTLYYTDSKGRDTGALMSMDMATGAKTVIAEDAKSDAGGILMHPTDERPQAVAFNYTRTAWKILDPSIQGDIDYLKTVAPGDLSIGSRSQDDRWWTVGYMLDNGPARAYLYDREAKKATFVYSAKKDLEGRILARMHPVVIQASDGLDMVCYLTLPAHTDADGNARPDKPLPMVLDVHGGPWARDSWGFNPEAQWLANRGYAVMQVNFRGSTGFGKNFVNAGNKAWGTRMHEDLIDVVNWAIREKVADAKKVAIYGGSYGGYAALAGVTFTPKVFACAVDIVGPSNLNTLLSTIPPYWKPMLKVFAERVGDHQTDEGREFLKSRSPLTYVDRIERPLLIGQGANDPRVKQSESDQIVQAMQAKGIPVTYVLYPDEGHGFARPPNRMSFYAIAEAFLARHLGGRVQPIGDDFNASTVTVPVGAEHVGGVSEALSNKP